ncbi:hypothetical protein BS47DRAFT_1304888 [Hydnum rufescens UP504]|uniref:Uncharacterized protein n=1 Tax=Hydnum rufescens UP504 TaxID=1448309 RepID=A0A9P6AJ86_9AGAM|nr:hypothetical protein BS47DRAFT_1304888 [Hydnum rufescens UP504]
MEVLISCLFQLKHPAIVKVICKQFQNFCAISVPVSHVLVKSQILGIIQSHAPKLLKDQKFKCSDTFIHKFLHSKLQWFMCTSTQVMQKTPDNWEKLCEDMFMHFIYYIKIFDIPAELIINADQTGICLIPVGNKTWACTGSKQVNTFAKDEKRQFSLMVVSSAASIILPFQAIIKGKT